MVSFPNVSTSEPCLNVPAPYVPLAAPISFFGAQFMDFFVKETDVHGFIAKGDRCALWKTKGSWISAKEGKKLLVGPHRKAQ